MPVAPVDYSDLVLVIHPYACIDSVSRLLAAAESRPRLRNDPSSGPVTPYHVAGELVESMRRVDCIDEARKGGSSARNDLPGRPIEMMFDAITSMAPDVQSCRV